MTDAQLWLQITWAAFAALDPCILSCAKLPPDSDLSKGTLGNLKAGIQRKEKDLLRTMAHFRTTTWLAEHRALLIRASCTKS